MKPKTELTGDNATRQISSAFVLGARLTWMGLGPIALVFATFAIVAGGTGWLTALDGFYGIVVGLMLLGRWVEFRSGAATTVTGAPATDSHFRRYLAGLPLVAVGVWIAANTLGNHVLGRVLP